MPCLPVSHKLLTQPIRKPPWCTATHHELLCICADFEQLRYSVHEALMVKVAHLLDLTVVVSYPGIQLLHEALVGVGLVIVNWPGNSRERRQESGHLQAKNHTDWSGLAFANSRGNGRKLWVACFVHNTEGQTIYLFVILLLFLNVLQEKVPKKAWWEGPLRIYWQLVITAGLYMLSVSYSAVRLAVGYLRNVNILSYN